MDDFALIAQERRRLAAELAQLTDDEWAQPSRCAGWTAHHVAAHLNMVWEIGPLTFAAAMARALGNFDRASDRLTRDLADRLAPADAVAGLVAHAEDRKTPPVVGALGPLTDTIVHGNDILAPLGRSVDVAPEALARVLGFLAEGRTVGFMPRSRVAGLRLRADDLTGTDAPSTFGEGEHVVAGPALAVACTVLGRTSMADRVTGDGVAVLLERLGHPA